MQGPRAADVLHAAGPENLTGKLVMDACNPIADAPPTNGVIAYFTGPNESLMERLQKKAPKAKVEPSPTHCRTGPGRERGSAVRLAFRSPTECPCLSGGTKRVPKGEL